MTKIVSLKTAQKLKRKGWPVGKSSLFYDKRAKCTVYDIKTKGEYAFFAFDAPNLEELKALCAKVGIMPADDQEQVAEQLLNYVKSVKGSFEDLLAQVDLKKKK